MWLIDADALLSEIGLDEYYHSNEIRDMLQDCPTIDPKSLVRHGMWKYYHKQNKAVCTNCSFERDLDVNFGAAISCPHCGAVMDLEE